MNRTARALAVSLLLAGCSADSNSDYAQFWQILRSGAAASFGNQSVTRKQAADIPYASMGWRLDGSNQSIIILATDNNGEQLWTSAARIVIVTHAGRVVRTVGLGHDLGGARPRGSGALAPPAAALKQPFTSTRLVDYPDTGHYGVELVCRARAVGRQTIAILGRNIATTRIEEDCTSKTLRWRFTDSYWVDPQDGTVWRTRQHIHPRLGVLETELFRPPG